MGVSGLHSLGAATNGYGGFFKSQNASSNYGVKADGATADLWIVNGIFKNSSATYTFDTSITSDTANTDNLGSSTIGWKHLYLDDANTTAPTTNGQISYNASNTRFEFYQNGSVNTLGGATAGTVILLSANETQASSAVTAQLKTYALGANSYSYIIVEGEGYMLGGENVESQWTLIVRDNAVQKGNSIIVKQDATGAGDFWTMPFSIKVVFTETTAQTLDIYAT